MADPYDFVNDAANYISSVPNKVINLFKSDDATGDYTSRLAAIARQQKPADALSQMGAQEQGVYTAGGFLRSDIRLKSNIVKVGDHPKGFGIYEYDIDGHRERGVLAQEVEKIIPEAVLEHPDGYKMVNYGAL